jgi:hypothetical protein
MVLPKNVARFFKKRPELVPPAIQALGVYLDINEEQLTGIPSDGNIPPLSDISKYEDWVWTVQTIGR